MLVLGLLVPAFLSGFFMFFAPCTLPLVPAYLAFISGVSSKNIEAEQHKIKKNSIFFVLGFSVIFILLGILLGLIGGVVNQWRSILLQIGGVIIILFGLIMMRVFRLPFLSQQTSIRLPSWIALGKPSSSFLVGAIFALGWSPCIGPILGTVLVVAGTLGTAWSGAVLLAVFSFGFSIPFLFVSFLYRSLHHKIHRYDRVYHWFSIVSGVIFVGMGVLLLLNQWNILSEWGFKLFDFLNYNKILNYL